MARIDDFLAVIDDPNAPPVQGDDPADELLLGLLGHVAFADGEIGEEEFALLSRLFPAIGSGEMLTRLAVLTESPLDVQALARICPTHKERSRAIRFATHMAWQDKQLDPGETKLIRDLEAQLWEIPEGG
jgi:uncharacterized membrane protein YebE (DUF533 family)